MTDAGYILAIFEGCATESGNRYSNKQVIENYGNSWVKRIPC